MNETLENKKNEANPTMFTLKHSDTKEVFDTGSMRDSEEGKGCFDLIPTLPLRRLAVLLQVGAARYGRHNWRKGQRLGRYLSSAFRHLLSLVEAKKDEDHASSLAFNAFAFTWTADQIEKGNLPRDLDDIGWCSETSN